MRCPACSEEKQAWEFRRDRLGIDGRSKYCTRCHDRESRRIRNAFGEARHYHLRRRYGMGADDIDRMIQDQGGVCTVCRKREAKQVDHDHVTGKVRGILCLQCNAGLGALHDDIRLVYEAIDYLSPTPWEELCH